MTALPHNPFKELRTKLGISQYELAKRVGVSKHAILRLEQGAYDNPLPSLVNYFTGLSHLHVSRPELLESYHQFQYETRQSNAGCLGFSLADQLFSQESPTKGCPVGIHPLTYLRTVHQINPTELSKRLCIAQNIIVYFEKRSISQKIVPEQLVRALWDADYTEEDTEALTRAYDNYREWLRAEKGLLTVVPDIKDSHGTNAATSSSTAAV